jgi:hypothetical protein
MDVRNFEVVEGQPVTIGVTFRSDQAFRQVGAHFQFFPQFDSRSD